jgi:metallo-beta-lactamase class B
VGNKDYPQIAADYEHSFQVLRALPCDLFLGAHGNYYGMAAKYAKLQKGEGNPFIDPAGYRAYLDDREQAFRKELNAQKQKANQSN